MRLADDIRGVVLSQGSALLGRRHVRTRQVLVPWRRLDAAEQRGVMRRATASIRNIDVGDLVRHCFWDEGKPFAVLVAKPARRRSNAQIRAHLRTKRLPAGSLMEVAPNLYCCSPEMVASQLAASSASPASVASVITELCSGFTMTDYDAALDDPTGTVLPDHLQRGYRKAEQATNLKEIARWLPHKGGSRHARKVTQALRIATEGCRSPMEAITAMQFSSPRALGGFGIAPLLVNHRVDFNEKAQRASGMPYAVCDAYLPAAHLSLEYNGNDHDQHYQRIHDERRTAGLQAMGISVIPLNDRQLRDIDALEAIAQTVYARSGRQYRNRVRGYGVKQVELLNALRASFRLSAC